MAEIKQISIKEAVKVSGKSKNTIMRWIKSGKIEADLKGGIWQINLESLNAATAGSTERKAVPVPETKKTQKKKKTTRKKVEAKQAAVKEQHKELESKKELVDIKEAARISGKSVFTLRDWVKKGKVESEKVHGVWKIIVESLPVGAIKSAVESMTEPVFEKKPVKRGRPFAKKADVSQASDKTISKEIESLRHRIERLSDEEGKIRKENVRLRDEIAKIHKDSSKLHEENARLLSEISGLHETENDRKKKSRKVIGTLSSIIELLQGLD